MPTSGPRVIRDRPPLALSAASSPPLAEQPDLHRSRRGDPVHGLWVEDGQLSGEAVLPPAVEMKSIKIR